MPLRQAQGGLLRQPAGRRRYHPRLGYVGLKMAEN
jgi:hypothetical protein